MRTELFMYFLYQELYRDPGWSLYSGRPLHSRQCIHTTDRSKTVVPMLFLFCVALYFTLRDASCLILPCSLSMCSFCPLAFWSACLGKRELVFVLIMHLFVSYAHVNLCHFFSSSWCQGLAATSACGSSWTFLFSFSLCRRGFGNSSLGLLSGVGLYQHTSPRTTI